MSHIEPCTLDVNGGLLHLKTAEASDAQRLLELLRKAYDETDFLTRRAAEMRLDVNEYELMLQRKADSETDLSIVALLDGEYVGFATLTGSPLERFRHEMVLAVLVRQAAWGRGIGSKLVDTLLSWADNQHVVRVSLEVDERNDRAVRLYRSRGFEVEGVLRARKHVAHAYRNNFLMARLRLPASSL